MQTLSHHSCNSRKPAPFVILSQPRTGSTLVCSLLCSHPGIRALVEPINPVCHNHHMKPIKGSKCLLPEVMVQNNIVRALELLFDRDPPPDKWVLSKKVATHAAGFKIMMHQLIALKSKDIFWKYLADNKIKVILVFRHNIVMQYISDLIVQETRQSACWDGKVLTAQVTVPINTLESNIRRIMFEKRYLINSVDKYGLDKRRLKYEDFKDDISPVNNLLPWLIGESANLTTKLSKQNPDSIMARVKNYNELIFELHRLDLGHLIVDN